MFSRNSGAGGQQDPGNTLPSAPPAPRVGAEAGTPASPKKSATSSLPLIAGGIGGALALAGVGAGLVIYLRKRAREAHYEVDEEGDEVDEEEAIDREDPLSSPPPPPPQARKVAGYPPTSAALNGTFGSPGSGQGFGFGGFQTGPVPVPGLGLGGAPLAPPPPGGTPGAFKMHANPSYVYGSTPAGPGGYNRGNGAW